MKSFSGPAVALSRNHHVIRMEHFNVAYADANLDMPAGYSLFEESEAIGRTLDSLGIKGRVNIVGWSFGALLALDFALNHPGRVDRLILYEPPAFWVAKACNESPIGMDQMINLTGTFQPGVQITDRELANFICLLNNCEPDSIITEPRWSALAQHKQRLRGLSVVANHQDSLSRIHKYPGLVLILGGEESPAFHKRINELLAEEFGNAKLRIIGGGHSAPQLALEAFVEAIDEFLKY